MSHCPLQAEESQRAKLFSGQLPMFVLLSPSTFFLCKKQALLSVLFQLCLIVSVNAELTLNLMFSLTSCKNHDHRRATNYTKNIYYVYISIVN